MVSELLNRISSLQSLGDEYFLSGQFPSSRENRHFKYHRLDSNGFSTLSVTFILNQLKVILESENQARIKSIVDKALKNLDKYRNKDGLLTYNFWQTKPSNHFPNGYILKRLKHFKLPDDIDDTSLTYLVAGYSVKDIKWLKSKLKEHSPVSKVYTTWFGEKMHMEYDICALSNLMYLLFDSKEELNENDLATLEYVNQIIVSGEYLQNSFWVSRHYATVPLIVYHVVRLIGEFEIPQLAEAKKYLLGSIPNLFAREDKPMNKLILQTAWYKLKSRDVDYNLDNWNFFEQPMRSKVSKDNEFYSFIGAPFAPFENSMMRFIASKDWSQIHWKCEAHELALMLENYVLKNLKKRN